MILLYLFYKCEKFVSEMLSYPISYTVDMTKLIITHICKTLKSGSFNHILVSSDNILVSSDNM